MRIAGSETLETRPTLLLAGIAAALAGCAAGTSAPGTPSPPSAPDEAPAQSGTPALTRLDQLSFLLGRWVGTQTNGRPLVLEFVRRESAIIVRMGQADPPPLYVMRLFGGRIVVEEAIDTSIDLHFVVPAPEVRELSPGLVGFDGFSDGARWRRVSDDVLEYTRLVREGEGFRRATTVLARDRNWQPAPEVHGHSDIDVLRLAPMAPVSFGPFVLVGPSNGLSPREAWIAVHDPQPWGLALGWMSADRLAALVVTDDGRVLKARALTRLSSACVLPEFYLQYDSPPFYRLTSERLEAMVRNPSSCLTAEQNEAVIREFVAARPHLDEALAALRSRAQTLFGTVERCRPPSGWLHSSLEQPHCNW